MVSHSGMNNGQLGLLLRELFTDLQGQPGCWKATLDEFDLFVMTDEESDRIRIMIPVAEADRRDKDLLWVLLLANYDHAVDARYAIHDDLVWCMFLHKLSWMTVAELHNALANVITLAKNTGSTFSSTELVVEGN